MSIFKKRMTAHDYEEQLTLGQIQLRFSELDKAIKAIQDDIYLQDLRELTYNPYPITGMLDDLKCASESMYRRIGNLEDKKR